jgi:hypothetical protein
MEGSGPTAEAIRDDDCKAEPAAKEKQSSGSPRRQELEQLEALADEIEAENVAHEEDEALAPPLVPRVGDVWQVAFDHNSQRPYFYNTATGVSRWDPPEDYAGPHSQAQAQSAAAVAAVAAGTSATPEAWQQFSSRGRLPGHYYRDAHGMVQGPYTLDQLQLWRGVLPMDLKLWRVTPSSAAAAGDGAPAAEPAATSLPAGTSKEVGQGAQPGGVQQQQQQGQGEGQAESELETLELAYVLGDEDLLARWREDYPRLVEGGGRAGVGGHMRRGPCAAEACMHR